MKIGEKYTKCGSIFEVASFFWYEASEMVNLYNLDDGEMISLHVEDTDEYTKFADPEPKMIVNTEKVKWAMTKLPKKQIVDRINEAHIIALNDGDVEFEIKIDLEHAEIIKDALSRPEKFDAVEHMKGGGILVDPDGNKYQINVHGYAFVNGCGPMQNTNVLLYCIIKDQLKPYVDTEPTHEEIVKKGWDILCELFDKELNVEDQQAVDAAINHFETLLEEE